MFYVFFRLVTPACELIEQSDEWVFSQALALENGSRRQASFAQGGRDDLSVHVFQRNVLAPTRVDAAVNAVKYVIQVAVVATLKRECPRCQQPDSSVDHQCAWPADPALRRALIEAVEIHEGGYANHLSRIEQVLRGQFSNGPHPVFATALTQAREELIQGTPIPAELVPLYKYLQQYAAGGEPNLMNFGADEA